MTITIPAGMLIDVKEIGQMFQRFHDAQHSGTVLMMVHFAQGHVRFIDIPDNMTRIPLDSKKKRAQA